MRCFRIGGGGGGGNFKPRHRKRIMIPLRGCDKHSVLFIWTLPPPPSPGNDCFRFLVDYRAIASADREKWLPGKLILSQCILHFT